MSIQTRKKAISKLVKLLNLATSNNLSESQMALRHAESLIRQHNLKRTEVINVSSLCDPAMLDQVNWTGQGRVFTSMFYSEDMDDDISNRRFSEKSVDPSNAYANVRTILDDEFEMDEQEKDPFKEALKSKAEMQMEAQKQSENLQKAKEEQAKFEDDMKQAEQDLKDELETQRAAQTSIEEDLEKDLGVEIDTEDQADIDDPQEDLAVALDEVDEESLDEEELQNLKESKVFEAKNPESIKARMDASFDNVINAASAFRPDGATDQFRSQYAASDPTIPFEEDPYWQKVYVQLLDFDEFQVQITIDKIECQLSLAQENVDAKRQLRREAEQEELSERSERARIELSFEEAIERAFQARAQAYQQWEKERAEIRMAHLKSEQEAASAYDVLSDDLQKQKEEFQLHLKRKQDYQAAKIMHDLRSHLAQAVSVGDEGQGSFEKVVNIMTDAGLSLRDLEFSDIKNKSLFIRLLERETAEIEDVVARERYTEEMLSKFLSSTMVNREAPQSENPLQLVEKLLNNASNSTQFEARKSLEQVFHIMSSNGISIRDINLARITKYSVFVRLLNWEAEQISSINEREAFTASVLEEYVKSSINNEGDIDDFNQKNKA